MEHRAHGLIRAFVRSDRSMAGEDPEAMLELLRHALPAHFHEEERGGGLYGELAARGVAPELLDRLRSDHRSFLEALDRLRAGIDGGEDVRVPLWDLARRLCVHERREAAAALQVGVVSCTEAPDPSPPLSDAAQDAVASIVKQAVARANDVPGRLIAGVVVNVGDLNGTAARWAVEDGLTAAGLAFVDVRAVTDGPVGLQHTIFDTLDDA